MHLIWRTWVWTYNLHLACVTFEARFFTTKRNYRYLLHNGHEPCLMSQLSMQGRWNIWWQWGKLLTVSPIWKSWSCTNLQCQFKLWLYFVMFDILKKIQTNVFGKVKLSQCFWCIIIIAETSKTFIFFDNTSKTFILKTQLYLHIYLYLKPLNFLNSTIVREDFLNFSPHVFDLNH